MLHILKYIFWIGSIGFLIILLLCLIFFYGSNIRPYPEPSATPPLKKQKNPDKEIAKQASQRQRVALRKVITPSDSAIREADKGRFIVNTSIGEGTLKRELYNHLLSRGGIIVMQDNQQRSYIVNGEDKRKRIEKSEVDLSQYALHRPRSIPLSDVNALPYSIEPAADEHVYLVMPQRFEAEVITYIEQQLPEPISHYSECHVEFSLGLSGNLNYKVINRE